MLLIFRSTLRFINLYTSLLTLSISLRHFMHTYIYRDYSISYFVVLLFCGFTNAKTRFCNQNFDCVYNHETYRYISDYQIDHWKLKQPDFQQEGLTSIYVFYKPNATKIRRRSAEKCLQLVQQHYQCSQAADLTLWDNGRKTHTYQINLKGFECIITTKCCDII